MPSPIGHAVGGIAAGWLVENLRGVRTPPALGATAAFAAAGVLPDLDLLFGLHRGATHGIGAALVAGLALGALSGRAVFGAAIAAAWASHILLDWMGNDTTPPIGMMALWPFDRSFYHSGIHLFEAISRRYWLPEFWTYNVAAVARELAILVPILGVAALWRRRKGYATPDAAATER